MSLLNRLFVYKKVDSVHKLLRQINNILVCSSLVMLVVSFIVKDEIDLPPLVSLIFLCVASFEYSGLITAPVATVWNFLTILYGLLPLSILYAIGELKFGYAGFLPEDKTNVILDSVSTSYVPWLVLIAINLVSRIALTISKFKYKSIDFKIANRVSTKKYLSTIYILWLLSVFVQLLSVFFPSISSFILFKFFATLFNYKTLSLTSVCALSLLINKANNEKTMPKVSQLWIFSYICTLLLMILELSKGSTIFLFFCFYLMPIVALGAQNLILCLRPLYLYFLLGLSPILYIITLVLRVFKSIRTLDLQSVSGFTFEDFVDLLWESQTTIVTEIASRLNANYGEKVLTLFTLNDNLMLSKTPEMLISDIKSLLNMLLPLTPFPEVLAGTSPYLTLATGTLKVYPYYKSIDEIMFDLNTSPFSLFGYFLVLLRNPLYALGFLVATLILIGFICNNVPNMIYRIFVAWLVFSIFNMYGFDVCIFNSLTVAIAFATIIGVRLPLKQ